MSKLWLQIIAVACALLLPPIGYFYTQAYNDRVRTRQQVIVLRRELSVLQAHVARHQEAIEFLAARVLPPARTDRPY
jgi:hypothetical protein